MILVHTSTTNSTWYKVLYHHTMYVCNGYIPESFGTESMAIDKEIKKKSVVSHVYRAWETNSLFWKARHIIIIYIPESFGTESMAIMVNSRCGRLSCSLNWSTIKYKILHINKRVTRKNCFRYLKLKCLLLMRPSVQQPISKDKNFMARTRKYYQKNNYLTLRSKVNTVCDTPPYGHATTYQINTI